MTLVPEGKIWNYGIGLTQTWSPSIPYSVTLDTPLLFWAEQHRPSAFLTVSASWTLGVSNSCCDLPSSLIWRQVMTVRTSKTVLPNLLIVPVYFPLLTKLVTIICIAYYVLALPL